jgi:Mn-containing catalase
VRKHLLSVGVSATRLSLHSNSRTVFTTGNPILDLLHNFFLENGARIHKLRVYETVNDPVSREVCGYLLASTPMLTTWL